LEITLKTFGTYWTFLLKELNVAQPKEQVVEIPAESKEPVEIAPTQPSTEQPATTETKKDYTWAWTLLFFALIASVLVSVIATRRHTKNIDNQTTEVAKTEYKQEIIPMPETKQRMEMPKPVKKEEIAIPESDLSKIRALDDINKRIDEINRNLRRF
jgi:hypothetical protein